MLQIPQQHTERGKEALEHQKGSEERTEATPLCKGVIALTILHLGPQLALLGVLKERLVLGLPHLVCLITAGFIKECSVSTWCCARKQTLPG